MRIGIDDTDSPQTMCTTYLGAVLVRRLRKAGIQVSRAYLVRLNPNVPFKTRGNAAIALVAEGNQEEAFSLACRCVEELADLKAEHTHPGVVVVGKTSSPTFYQQAVQDFCSLEDAYQVLDKEGALYRGYKIGRGLIGATAAVCAEFSDVTFEWLAYRPRERWGSNREVDGNSLGVSEESTSPHTWDTIDRQNHVVVCVPHTPDPVLFGIRGDSPFWVARARSFVQSEQPFTEQLYLTNQGTDAHLRDGTIGTLKEGRSYLLPGIVFSRPETLKGGHVRFVLQDMGRKVRCMAYEPTKGFRDIVRALVPGDHLLVAGSYKKESINLEKVRISLLEEDVVLHSPLCTPCNRRMTSAGKDKGYKCRSCGARSFTLERIVRPRLVHTGWYEVPSCARRHLAKPLVRAPSFPSMSL
ncbi:MAG: tRNA(Ile)(2)-agmatinylcytidine synthase [Methanomicrobiales archaeon]|nr:tRNA(Ile)(2)-agmatinylcytidine synthase [Methanomicrobiales archaeon]